MQEKSLTLHGKAGKIEAILTPALTADSSQFAIVCHPHSLQGGTMQNKVVTTLVKVFHALNIHCLRFNFRGVGKTESEFDHGKGEADDVLQIMEWVKKEYNNPGINLAGFSFGAAVAFRVATRISLARLILIAPPVNHFSFEAADKISCPWWIIQGEEDEVVPFAEVSSWIKQLHSKPKFIAFPDTGHFFHGKLIELREVLTTELRNYG